MQNGVAAASSGSFRTTVGSLASERSAAWLKAFSTNRFSNVRKQSASEAAIIFSRSWEKKQTFAPVISP
jgi:hypothetical protein